MELTINPDVSWAEKIKDFLKEHINQDTVICDDKLFDWFYCLNQSNPNQKITDIRGRILETKDSPVININGEVIYLKKQKRNYKEINLKEITINRQNS